MASCDEPDVDDVTCQCCFEVFNREERLPQKLSCGCSRVCKLCLDKWRLECSNNCPMGHKGVFRGRSSEQKIKVDEQRLKMLNRFESRNPEATGCRQPGALGRKETRPGELIAHARGQWEQMRSTIEKKEEEATLLLLEDEVAVMENPQPKAELLRKQQEEEWERTRVEAEAQARSLEMAQRLQERDEAALRRREEERQAREAADAAEALRLSRLLERSEPTQQEKRLLQGGQSLINSWARPQDVNVGRAAAAAAARGSSARCAGGRAAAAATAAHATQENKQPEDPTKDDRDDAVAVLSVVRPTVIDLLC